MRVSKGLVRSWLPVLVAFFIGASMVGTSWAVTTVFTGTVKAKNFAFTSQKTVRLVIGAAAFIPNTPGCSFDYEGGHHFHDFGTGCVYSAQVELPQRARVTKVIWTLANGAGSVLTLNAWDPGTIPAGTAIVTLTSPCSGLCNLASTSVATAQGANPVNNAASSYSLDIDTDASGTITVDKVTIFYKTNRVGPASA